MRDEIKHIKKKPNRSSIKQLKELINTKIKKLKPIKTNFKLMTCRRTLNHLKPRFQICLDQQIFKSFIILIVLKFGFVIILE